MTAVAAPAQAALDARIDPDTTLGPVSLTVADLARSRAFYEQAIGLRGQELDDGGLTLAGNERPLLELRGDSSAPPLQRTATGLYHLAILVPTRLDLALALARLAAFQWPLDGASDHLVSEALYLSDPDGNGIEIYRDRPRNEWRRVGGQLQMATLPLDLESLAGELRAASGPQALLPAGTRIGHVHLQVASLEQAEAFYHELLGFDVMVRGYPGALFVSAGGYHHHIGLNTWHSAGAAPAPPGSVGLRSFEVVLPSADQLAGITARLHRAGAPVETTSAGTLTRDPSGNAVLLRARG